MVEDILVSLPENYIPGTITEEISFYFSLEDVKKTVKLTADSCLVEEGRTVDSADCVCKTTKEFFAAIWDDGYRPGVSDFLSGKIKSNNPTLLQEFLKSFGKAA